MCSVWILVWISPALSNMKPPATPLHALSVGGHQRGEGEGEVLGGRSQEAADERAGGRVTGLKVDAGTGMWHVERKRSCVEEGIGFKGYGSRNEAGGDEPGNGGVDFSDLPFARQWLVLDENFFLTRQKKTSSLTR